MQALQIYEGRVQVVLGQWHIFIVLVLTLHFNSDYDSALIQELVDVMYMKSTFRDIFHHIRPVLAPCLPSACFKPFWPQSSLQQAKCIWIQVRWLSYTEYKVPTLHSVNHPAVLVYIYYSYIHYSSLIDKSFL